MALRALVNRDPRMRSSFRLRRVQLRGRSRRRGNADSQPMIVADLPANQVARSAWVELGGRRRRYIRFSINAALNGCARDCAQRLHIWSSRLRLSPRSSMHVAMLLCVIILGLNDGFPLLLESPRAAASPQVPSHASAFGDRADMVRPVIPFSAPLKSAVIRQARPSVVDSGPRLLTPTPALGQMFVDDYVLQPHDTLAQIAERYGLHVESLLGSNSLGEYMAIGDSIRIPRVDGVVHTVVVDETLNHIAQLYQVDSAMILTYPANNLDRGQALQEGQEIFIPYAQLPAERRPQLELADVAAVPIVVVKADDTRVWSGPGDDYKRLWTVQHGDQLQVLAHYDAWLQVQSDAGDVWIEQEQILAPGGAIESVAEATVLPKKPPVWVWPTMGSVSSPFGWRDLNGGKFHNGIDIANRQGTPIYAVRRGTVTEAGWCSGFGYCVKMKHSDGFSSTYGHMMTRPNVTVGQWVEADELIGLMGTTYDLAGGGYSTGPHLHLTLKLDGVAVDPLRWLTPGR